MKDTAGDSKGTDALIQDAVAQIRKELGISRPNSPAAAGTPKGGPVSTDDFDASNRKYDSREGPRALIARTKALRDEAAKALPRSG